MPLSAADIREIESVVRRVIGEALTEGGDPYLSAASAARYADVSPATVRRWIRSGDLPAVGSGKLLRVRQSDLERFMESRGGSVVDIGSLARGILGNG